MKICQIKSIYIEMLIFVVLLFSYPYIIDTLSIVLRRNTNTGGMMQPYVGALFSFGISIVFAVLMILGIILIKRISAKTRIGLFVIFILLVFYIVVPICCLLLMETIKTSVIVKWFVAATIDRTFFTTLLIWMIIDVMYIVKSRFK